MIGLLHEWQELASGILALIAGAFIFIQGTLDRRRAERDRQYDITRLTQRTNSILERLNASCSQLDDQIQIQIEILEDVFEAVNRGDPNVDVPQKLIIPKIFETIFAQLTTLDVSVDLYLKLSLLLEKNLELDDDYRRFLINFGQKVIEHRSYQPRLPFGGMAQPSSEEPAAQTLVISTKALQAVVRELRTLSTESLAEDKKDHGSDVCTGKQCLE